MAKAPVESLIEYLEPVKVIPNSEKTSSKSPKFKPTLNAIEKKLADILPPREFDIDAVFLSRHIFCTG